MILLLNQSFVGLNQGLLGHLWTEPTAKVDYIIYHGPLDKIPQLITRNWTITNWLANFLNFFNSKLKKLAYFEQIELVSCRIDIWKQANIVNCSAGIEALVLIYWFNHWKE